MAFSGSFGHERFPAKERHDEMARTKNLPYQSSPEASWPLLFLNDVGVTLV